MAVDVAPYPIDWNDPARFARLFGYIERIANELQIPIRWGGDWNRNWRTKDERLIDLPHIELDL
jgi:peptidoglycan L-alanyl-D-glutamate endopeptidase CwlK